MKSLLELARRGEDDYLILSFTRGKRPKTDETQWSFVTRDHNHKTTRFVVHERSPQPTSSEEQWICRKDRIRVNKPDFQIIAVRLISCTKEKRNERPNKPVSVAAKVQKPKIVPAVPAGIKRVIEQGVVGPGNYAIAKVLQEKVLGPKNVKKK